MTNTITVNTKKNPIVNKITNIRSFPYQRTKYQNPLAILEQGF